MAVVCAQCGEELMGAVNRCWKCGQPVLSTPDAGVAPPVRRLPVRLPADAPPKESRVHEMHQDTAAEGRRVHEMHQDAAVHSMHPTRAAVYQQQGAAGWGAIGSLVLGLAALGLGGFFSAAIVLALLGVAAGIWGLRSRRRTIATLGLLVCCLGTTVSGLRLAYDSFIWIHGDPPIRVGPEELPDDDMLLDEGE